MSGKRTNIGDKKIRKSNFYKNKKLFKIYDIDIDNILVSKKIPYGTKNSFKYFIGYSADDDIKPLCTKLPQMIGCIKCFENNGKTISFRSVIKNECIK